VFAPLVELEKCLASLPGLGRRSAQRAALQLLREKERLLKPLVAALTTASAEMTCCSRCGAFTAVGRDPCDLCVDATRESSLLCVVEEPADILSIEASGVFKGRYHALGGKLAPARRMGPERLRFAALKSRVAGEGISEVILALSTDMDGDATASYAQEILRGLDVKVTRLAFGLPADSGIAYSDPLTLRRALRGRQEV